MFDSTSPPNYPYFKAILAYSAVVQLYCRSGQLDTASSLANRFCSVTQPWCHFGCRAIEDPHHIFVICPHFTSHRISASTKLNTEIMTLLRSLSLSANDHHHLLAVANSMCADLPPWPSRRSFYYLGCTPQLKITNFPCILSRVNQIFHSAAIRLAGHIWGIVHRHSHLLPASNSLFSSQSAQSTPADTSVTKPVITLPTFFPPILHTTSYPSFSISFQNMYHG